MTIRQTWKAELYINQGIRNLIKLLDYIVTGVNFAREQDSKRHLL